MKLLQLLPLAALSAAFVVPDEEVLAKVAIEAQDEVKSWLNLLPSKSEIVEIIRKPCQQAKEAAVNEFDRALAFIEDVTGIVTDDLDDSDYAINGWLEPGIETDYEGYESLDDPHHPHPPPPPHHPDAPHPPPGKHKPRHPHHPHHPPHHKKSNKTIYELISGSKYTTILAELINEDSELVSLLNSTKANHTIFAPTDEAFKKIPKGHKPSKEIIKKVLRYHIAPGSYPAGRVLFSKTVPTLLKEPLLGDEPQRVAGRISLRGLTLNFYARAVAVNIGASNGFIHGLDAILIPPPKITKILSLLPGEFSTLLLGLSKTGLLETLTEAPRVGGTFFAPGNNAFRKLGPKVNAFLFSKPGERFLAALLKYHFAPNQTLYQTAFYNGSAGSSQVLLGPSEFPPQPPPPFPQPDSRPSYVHFQLPTLLSGKSIAVDVGRAGPFVSVRLNGFIHVVVADGVARDGVIHVPNFVLVPPKKVPGGKEEQLECWNGEEMDLDDFKSRLEPLLDGESGVDVDGEEREFSILPIGEWKDL